VQVEEVDDGAQRGELHELHVVAERLEQQRPEAQRGGVRGVRVERDAAHRQSAQLGVV